MSHPIRFLLVLLAALVALSPANAQTALPSGLEIELLPGYVHQPLQGIDSIVGKLSKKGGPEVLYEIGRLPKPGAPRLGGDFTNQAEQLPAAQTLWRKKQKVAGREVHVAYGKDQRLVISTAFKTIGVNFSSEAKTPEDVAEVLLMILTLNEKVRDK